MLDGGVLRGMAGVAVGGAWTGAGKGCNGIPPCVAIDYLYSI